VGNGNLFGQNGGSAPTASGPLTPPKSQGLPSEFVLTAEEPRTPSPQSSGQASMSHTLKASRSAKTTNGFRPLSLSAREESRLVFQTDPNGFAAEQFRMLRQTLRQEFPTGGALMITSPGMGDGKTVTSFNLCTSLAQSGAPTLLVEMDIRRPRSREILGRSIAQPGLEDALAGKVEPGKVVYWIKELNLHAAVVAKIPENPSSLLGGMRCFLEWARKHFVWVVLDAPPVLPTADVPELLPLVDAAVLVIRAQTTPRDLSKRAIEILGKGLRGVIFNEVTVDTNPHYRYLTEYTQNADAKSGETKALPGNNSK
jgi:Mrp family chromosome partitioning ATPase